MKQLLAWTGSADSTITSEAVMAMAEKFNTGQEVCLQIPNARGVMQVKEGTSGSYALPVNGLKIETQSKLTLAPSRDHRWDGPGGMAAEPQSADSGSDEPRVGPSSLFIVDLRIGLAPAVQATTSWATTCATHLATPVNLSRLRHLRSPCDCEGAQRLNPSLDYGSPEPHKAAASGTSLRD